MEYYCDFAIGNPVHGAYHDRECGFPIGDERELFERLLLEINQAGLNPPWLGVAASKALNSWHFRPVWSLLPRCLITAARVVIPDDCYQGVASPGARPRFCEPVNLERVP